MDRSDIPSGLNRIKTRRVPPEDSSGGDDSPAPAVARSILAPDYGGGAFKTSEVRKTGAGSQRTGDSKGFRRGKKIARWFSSYLSVTDSRNISSNSPECESKKAEVKTLHKVLSSRNNFVDSKEMTGRRSTYESISVRKIPGGKKSFSHELGPRGGTRPSQPRARSYNDLKELLGSFHSKCHASKDVVNVELADFVSDLVKVIENDSLSETKCLAKDLLILAQNCMEMSCSEFREKCEGIVQELVNQRLHCREELSRQILTRMLFILTRCTRLLQFQKDGGAINEDSLHKFRVCLESIPVVELSWPKKTGKIEPDSMETHDKDEVQREYIQLEGDLPGGDPVKPVLDSTHEQEELSELNSVICRICEECVPTSNLESHSYICAYADKCDLEGIDIDDRLAKISEILEQIFESYAQKVSTSVESPDSVSGSSNRSPKVLEWHNKGLDGMFEDLHEMDTAFLDESHLSSFSNLKGHLSVKIGSSNGSMTPASSSSTPRANHFDLFWLEHSNPFHLEDANQINKLAKIARRIENINFKMEGALENLGACMRNLQSILYCSKVKALVVDSFGSRLRTLLKEKYLMASQHGDHQSFGESILSEDHSFQSTTSTPHSSYKERMSIDDFEIMKPISRGAFGEVFLARKRTTGDLFAIKVLKKLHMIRKNDIERILAERNILITVRNPFVVRFFYSFTCRDNLYLVMEYLNGGDLYSLLRKNGCLEEDIARIYIAELVLALEYLHSLGIVHRDLKPDNILIARDGHIKLTDFGLSKIGLINKAVDLSGSGPNNSILLDPERLNDSTEYASNEEDKENINCAVGTPDYLAPEILLGTEHGHAADWWSVGIILFEFITGIPPFNAELPERIFENILNRKIPWPEVPEEMSLETKDLIERLLILEPNQRLGANGASEVKAHPFFKKVDWANLALQKAVFVPNPDSADDTSYFLSRYSLTSLQTPEDPNFSDCLSEATDSGSHYGNEINEVDLQSECRDSSSSPSVDLSGINFSFKNLSQLASMNYDVLLQSGRLSKSSSPLKGPSSQP